MRRLLGFTLLLVITVTGCAGGARIADAETPRTAPVLTQPLANPDTTAAQNPFPVIHVFVALCDNVNQGIVPVSAALGNGDNPHTNLYWGAAFGVKTFLQTKPGLGAYW
jgi:hypothetical protein